MVAVDILEGDLQKSSVFLERWIAARIHCALEMEVTCAEKAKALSFKDFCSRNRTELMAPLLNDSSTRCPLN
jgi:hypothetical protein